MEVTFISDYLKASMPLPQYLPYARFLLNADLSHTAKLLYTLLLDRATLSQKNNWVDEQEHIYVVYSGTNLQHCRQPLPQPEAFNRYHESDAGRNPASAGYRPCPYL